MEAEEYEQIPWSNLVADSEPSRDRRLYIAGAAIAAIVIAFLAARMFGSPAPSVAAPLPVTVAPSVAPAVVDPQPTVPFVADDPIGGVSEADLMADVGNPELADVNVPVLIAEWFVTDYFTRDGSPETLASLEAALANPDLATDLPHHEEASGDAFVEWARAFDVTEVGDGLEVSVAYRSVHAEEGGFIRDSVKAVKLTLTETGGRWLVTSLPTVASLP